MDKPSHAELIAFAKLHAPEALERMERIKQLEADLKAFLASKDWSLSQQNAKMAELAALRSEAKADGAKLMQLWKEVH